MSPTWIAISAESSVWVSDLHDLHDMHDMHEIVQCSDLQD